MSRKEAAIAIFVSLVCSACATPGSPSDRVGDLRGKIVRIEREQGLIAVAANPNAEHQWFKIAPFTAVRGPDIKRVDALQTGQRVYVRYLSNPKTDPPEVLSITVVRYRLEPEKGGGIGSFDVPGF